jgi:hypothetical protein
MLNFLGNLRDMKSSLTSGMILLFCVWLIFGNEVADIQSDDSLAGNMRRLTEYLGPVGTLGLVGFVAYIVGLVLSLDRAISFYINRIAPAGKLRGVAMSKTTDQRLGKFLDVAITEALSKASPGFVAGSIFRTSNNQGDEKNRVLSEVPLVLRLQRLLGEEMDILAVQLLAKREKAYDKYDKAKTEAEFRAAIAIPIFILGVVVGTRLLLEQFDFFLSTLSIAILCMIIFVSLVYKSKEKQQEANEEIINAIIVGDIEFAPLTILKDIADGALTANKDDEANSQIAVPQAGPLVPREG